MKIFLTHCSVPVHISPFGQRNTQDLKVKSFHLHFLFGKSSTVEERVALSVCSYENSNLESSA